MRAAELIEIVRIGKGEFVPGTGELEPAVKNQLKLYGYNSLTNPGLYAVWEGK